MATTTSAYSLIPLGEAAQEAADRGFGLGTEADAGRGRVYIRRDADINSFGVNAFFQAAKGGIVIGDHDELGVASSHHEELYVVVSGAATFTIGGEDVDAQTGAAVFVPDVATKRGAVAAEDGTLILVVGGRPGEVFKPGPTEAMGAFFRLYRDEDYAGALAACNQALELHPDNGLILYNVACLENLLGNGEAALAALGEALAAWPDFKQNAAEDDDLASLRDDARFKELVAEPS
jgi:mannose-6-phosphate isomerase-like protein (cupin superfamily)